MGEPLGRLGGSLNAAEYKLAATTVLPIIVREISHHCYNLLLVVVSNCNRFRTSGSASKTKQKKTFESERKCFDEDMEAYERDIEH